MAKNLRTKIPESDTMIVHDVNPTACESIAKELGNIEVAKNVREVAEKAVRGISIHDTPCCLNLLSTR